MVNKIALIKGCLGFGLQGFGFFWGVFDRFICDSLCEKGICTKGDNFICFGLLLFVAIIFIIAGYALITMKPRKKKRIKRKISKKLKKWRIVR